MSKDGKAKISEIELGPIKTNIFRKNDGSYIFAQYQVTETVDKLESSFRRFLSSKSPYALPCKGFESADLVVEGSNKPIRGVPIPVAAAYWAKEAQCGNKKAIAINVACTVESIERRADRAFGVCRTEEEYNQRSAHIFRQIMSSNAEVNILGADDGVRVSSPLYEFYDAVKTKLKNEYAVNGIHAMSKEEIRKEIAFLSSHTTFQHWKLTPQQEIESRLGRISRNKYPDLMSGLIPVNARENAIFLFQVCEFIVKLKDIHECVKCREYIQAARTIPGVDHAFLFFIAPFGATPDACSYINELPTGEMGTNGSVGVLTLKELLEFYRKQSLASRKMGTVKGQINELFQSLSYDIPDAPLQILMNYQPSIF